MSASIIRCSTKRASSIDYAAPVVLCRSIGIDRPMIADALCFAARNRISITILTDSRAWTSNAEGFNHPEIRANIPTIIIGSSRIGLKTRKKRAKDYCRSKCDKYLQRYYSINILFRTFSDFLTHFYLEDT